MARPITQTDLYRTITGDRQTPHRTIGAELDKQLPTHRRVIALYAQGLSDRQVGERTNRHHGAARGMLRRAMFAVYKRIHHLPRYHIKGREHGYQIRKTKLPNLAKLPEPAARPTRHGRAKDLAAVTHIARKVERRNRDAQGHLLPSKVTPRPQK